MVFSSPVFLFLFLPAVLGAVYLLRVPRNLMLLLFSLLFYTWGEGVLVLIMLFTIAANYIAGLLIAGWHYSLRHPPKKLIPGVRRSGWQRLGLLISILANLGLLGFYKYFDFGVGNLNALLGMVGLESWQYHPAFTVTLPLGISFFTFQSMSYTFDVYLGHTRASRNLIDFACYVTMFPQLVAGPIVRYTDIAVELKHRDLSLERFSYGAERFIIGLAKKVLIANVVARPVDDIFALANGDLTCGLAWLAMIGYSLQIYFDFSGYSDMAIGLGHMFGFKFMENFNYPYISRSITEFWRRWHISLSTWFRDYLYIPLGGNRRGPARTYFNLFLVFFLCGLWHGASWNFVVWGIWHGVFLVIERVWLGKVLGRVWRPLSHLYTFLVFIVGWVFFRAGDFGQALAFLQAMVGLGHGEGLAYNVFLYLNNQVILFGALGILGSAPLWPWLQRWFAKGLEAPRPALRTRMLHGGWTVFELCWIALLMIASCASLATNTYNPFIYFRF